MSAEYLDQPRVKQPSSEMPQAPDRSRFARDSCFVQDGLSFAFLLGPKHMKEGPLLALILKMMTICTEKKVYKTSHYSYLQGPLLLFDVL